MPLSSATIKLSASNKKSLRVGGKFFLPSGEVQNALGHFVFVANVVVQNLRGVEYGEILWNFETGLFVKEIDLREVVKPFNR